MMQYFARFVAIGTLSLSAAAPLAGAQAPPAMASAAQPQTLVAGTAINPAQCQITGRVVTPNGNPVANTTIRARNLIDGQIGGSATTASAGQYSITVSPGSYMLEVVDAGGQVIGTSPFIASTAGATITGATVTISAGALGAATTTAGLASTLGTTIARSVTYAAAAAGVAGLVTPADVTTASPSR